jgi:hypothetical protein
MRSNEWFDQSSFSLMLSVKRLERMITEHLQKFRTPFTVYKLLAEDGEAGFGPND